MIHYPGEGELTVSQRSTHSLVSMQHSDGKVRHAVATPALSADDDWVIVRVVRRADDDIFAIHTITHYDRDHSLLPSPFSLSLLLSYHIVRVV